MGHSCLLPGYLVVRNPAYPFHVLLMVRSGVLHFRDGQDEGVDQEFLPGSMLFLPARSWYMYGADAPLELLWFHLRPEAAEWHFLNGCRYFHDTAGDLECLRSLVSVLYRECNTDIRHDSGITGCGVRMVELLLRRGLSRFAPEPVSARNVRALFESLEVFLEKKWSVASLARSAGISQSALFFISRCCFGKPPMARLHELRMNAAANLLRNTSYKLDAIASMVGFSCGFSLSRAFRKFYGVAPCDYRKGLRRSHD